MKEKKIITSHIWYYNKFGSQLEDLKRLRKQADGESLAKIDETISILESLFYEDEIYTVLKEECLFNRISGELGRLEDISDFLDVIMPLSSDEGFDWDTRYISTPKLTDEELFSLVHDFYRDSTDAELFKIFRGMFKKRNRLVHLSRLQEIEPISESIFLPYYHKVHIRMKRKRTINDILELSHEYGHLVQYLMNYDKAFFESNYMFTEIVSLFFELLNADYLKHFEEFRSASIQSQTRTYNSMLEDSDLLLIETGILSLWVELIDKGVPKVNETLERELNNYVKDYKKITLGELLDMNLPLEFIYVLGYIIAIELFMIYSKDRDRGLYLLKKLIAIDISLPKKEYFKAILELGIQPCESLEDYKSHIINPKKCNF